MAFANPHSVSQQSHSIMAFCSDSALEAWFLHILPLKTVSTRVVQNFLKMLGFHRYKRLILAKFVILE